MLKAYCSSWRPSRQHVCPRTFAVPLQRSGISTVLRWNGSIRQDFRDNSPVQLSCSLCARGCCRGFGVGGFLKGETSRSFESRLRVVDVANDAVQSLFVKQLLPTTRSVSLQASQMSGRIPSGTYTRPGAAKAPSVVPQKASDRTLFCGCCCIMHRRVSTAFTCIYSSDSFQGWEGKTRTSLGLAKSHDNCVKALEIPAKWALQKRLILGSWKSTQAQVLVIYSQCIWFGAGAACHVGIRLLSHSNPFGTISWSRRSRQHDSL